MWSNNKTPKRHVIILIVCVGITIISLSCIDGSIYPNFCTALSSSLGLSYQETAIAILDQPTMGHAAFYALLTFLLLQVTTLFASTIIAFSLGGLLEIIQIYLPTRQPLLKDFFADVLGVLCAIIIFYFFVKTKHPTTESDAK